MAPINSEPAGRIIEAQSNDPTTMGRAPYPVRDVDGHWRDSASSAPSLASVAGVDMEAALRRVEDHELLLELLAQLAVTWRDGAGRVARALAVEGREKAHDVAHALAGVAATLAVGRVRDAAQRIEARLESPLCEGIDDELTELEAALASFVAALNEAQPRKRLVSPT